MSRDRDRILEQALKHELRAAGTSPAGACLDAETLGAWADGGLNPAALAAAEAHVSNCARCQALVSTVIKSAPSTLGTPGTLGTFSLWKWWLAPIAAGVTAVTLWMVVPEQQELATAPPQPEIAATAETPSAEAKAPVAAPSIPAAAPEKQTTMTQPTDRMAARDRNENKVAAVSREDRQREKDAGARKEATALQEQVRLADADAPRAGAAPTPPPAAAPPASPTAALRAPAELGALQKRARAIAAPPGIEVTDQSAPSDSVCWFVGRAGLVLLTTDAGATFKRVDLAEPLDITSVSATDARIAVVTVAGGRRFRTEDGGSTWRPF